MIRSKVFVGLSLALPAVAACSGHESDIERIGSVSGALDPASVLGFESATQWATTAGSLGTSSTRDQGSFSVAISSGVSYVEVSNAPAPLSTLTGVTSTVSVDIRLSSTVSWGYAALSINSSQAGIYNAWISQVSLVGVSAGSFNTVSFMLPSNIVTALSGTYSDLTFKVILNIPPTTGLTYLDNLRFVQGPSLLAKTVFGHNDLKTTVPNEVVANRMFTPGGVYVDRSTTPNRVYVFDSGNMRILGFDSLGSCSGGSSPGKACTNDLDCPGTGATCSIDSNKVPKLVFGQKDALSATCNGDNEDTLPASASTLCSQPYPRAISLLESGDGLSMVTDSAHNFYLADKWNHRVLKYNDPFSNSDVTADYVWGQPDFTSRQCNQDSTPSASTLCLNTETTGIHISGDQMGTGVDVDPQGNVWVTDVGNNRVLRFPPNSKTANLVLGQSGFTSVGRDPTECNYGAASTGQHLCWPKVVRYNSTTNQVFVIDWRAGDSINDPNAPVFGDFRVLIYNSPFASGMSASEVLVGSDFGTINTSVQRWRRPTGLDFEPGSSNSFWFSDSKHDRLLFYTKASGSWQATKVLSQANLTDVYEIGVNCANGTLPNDSCLISAPNGGMGIDSAGNLYVTDGVEYRVMRFTSNPPNAQVGSGTGSAIAANAILYPLPSNTTVAANKVSAKGLYSANGSVLIKYPAGTSPQTQLLVLDQDRAVFWNNYATRASGDPADGVLYQSDLNSQLDAVGTLGVVTANTSGSKIFIVTESEIDVYQGPLTTGMAPFTTIPLVLPFRLGGSTGTLQPVGLAYDEPNDVLWIADHTGHRVLRLASPLSANRVINLVLGQPSAASLNPNRGLDDENANGMACPSVQPDGFGNMSGVHLDKQGNLYVLDGTHEGWQCSNDRALEYDASALLPAQNQDFFCGVLDSGCTTYRRPTRVYGPADFTHKDQSEGGPTNTPNTPISVAFDSNNHMMMVVDGYGNPLGKRVFFYSNPVPSCTLISGCPVSPSKILPFAAAQPTDVEFDPDGNMIIMDQTWTRVGFFASSDVTTWMNAP
jgi:sugar lactone lactonase YvrE